MCPFLCCIFFPAVISSCLAKRWPFDFFSCLLPNHQIRGHNQQLRKVQNIETRHKTIIMGVENPFTLPGEISLFSYAGTGPEEFFFPSEVDIKKSKTTVTVKAIDPDSSDSDSAQSVPVQPQRKEWKPTSSEMLVMVTLAFISLMVALDANVIVTSLAVSSP